MKVLFTLAVLMLLNGCALGKDSNDQNTHQIRQNKEVNDLYGPLVGNYSGKLRETHHGDEDVQLIIYINSEAVTNPDGTPGSKDVPMGYFRRSSPIIADYQTDVSGLTRELGELTMRNLGNQPDVRSLRLKVNGRQLIGPVFNQQGTLGKIDVTWVSSDTSARNDFKDRLLRQYQAVEGEYYGKLVTKDKMRAKWEFCIALSAVVAGEEPKLIGYYKRLDVKDGVVDLPLTVSYRPDQAPPQITLNGRGGGKYQLDMDGTLVNRVMQININSLYEGNYGLAKLRSQACPKGKASP